MLRGGWGGKLTELTQDDGCQQVCDSFDYQSSTQGFRLATAGGARFPLAVYRSRGFVAGRSVLSGRAPLASTSVDGIGARVGHYPFGWDRSADGLSSRRRSGERLAFPPQIDGCFEYSAQSRLRDSDRTRFIQND